MLKPPEMCFWSILEPSKIGSPMVPKRKLVKNIDLAQKQLDEVWNKMYILVIYHAEMFNFLLNLNKMGYSK